MCSKILHLRRTSDETKIQLCLFLIMKIVKDILVCSLGFAASFLWCFSTHKYFVWLFSGLFIRSFSRQPWPQINSCNLLHFCYYELSHVFPLLRIYDPCFCFHSFSLKPHRLWFTPFHVFQSYVSAQIPAIFVQIGIDVRTIASDILIFVVWPVSGINRRCEWKRDGKSKLGRIQEAK